MCFYPLHEYLLLLCILFRVFLVRLLFYAVCPGKGVRGLGKKIDYTSISRGRRNRSPGFFVSADMNDSRPGPDPGLWFMGKERVE